MIVTFVVAMPPVWRKYGRARLLLARRNRERLPSWVQNPDATAEQRARAVERAASRIGERRYSLTANNCEHFANWCATGAAISHQVIAFFMALARMVLAAAVSFLALCVAQAALAE